jgi:hypothetical protein
MSLQDMWDGFVHIFKKYQANMPDEAMGITKPMPPPPQSPAPSATAAAYSSPYAAPSIPKPEFRVHERPRETLLGRGEIWSYFDAYLRRRHDAFGYTADEWNEVLSEEVHEFIEQLIKERPGQGMFRTVYVEILWEELDRRNGLRGTFCAPEDLDDVREVS